MGQRVPCPEFSLFLFKQEESKNIGMKNPPKDSLRNIKSKNGSIIPRVVGDGSNHPCRQNGIKQDEHGNCVP